MKGDIIKNEKTRNQAWKRGGKTTTLFKSAEMLGAQESHREAYLLIR
jgi:hypothetical protein